MEVLKSFEIALPAGVFAKATEGIERMLFRFPSLQRIVLSCLGTIGTHGEMRHKHNVMRDDRRYLIIDDQNTRAMCTDRWLDVHQVYEEIRLMLQVKDQEKREEPIGISFASTSIIST